MIKIFLTAKHWQLFLLSTGILIVFQFVLIFNVFSLTESVIRQGKEPDLLEMFSKFVYLPFIILLNLVIVNGWMWSVGVGLQKKIPEPLRMNPTKFKIAALYVFIVTIMFLAGMAYVFTTVLKEIPYQGGRPDPEMFQSVLGILLIFVPLQMLSVVCSFYCIYFAAKTIKTAELQKELNFENYMAEFFLIWFFAIGVWILQPKVNKMLDESGDI